MDNDRKKYDMEQARAMRRKPTQTSTSSPRTRTRTRTRTKKNSNHDSNHVNELSSSQATKALQELDQAEELAKRNKLEESSALYQHAIAYLLQYMNVMCVMSSSSSSPSCDADGDAPVWNKDILMERIKLALTHAEDIKLKLKQRRDRNAQQYMHIQQQQQQHSRRQGLLASRGKSKSEKIPPAQQSRSISSSSSNTKSNPSAIHVNAPSLQTSKSADAHISHRNSTASASRSNLDYKSNDPFIQTIKNDLYIDSKTLTTKWDDISGLANAKQALQEAAILPLLRPDLYTGLRSAPRGILLYGPPGTGKTMLVRAVAYESECILFACSASAMTSKWVGEGEKLVRTLFRMAADVAPSIIFLDEMDSLLGRRSSSGGEQESSRRFKTEFMVQMDGISAGSGKDKDVQHKTLLIGCTNCPWDVDDAVMRRFQRRIYIPLPDLKARMTLWKKIIEKSDGSVHVNSRDLEKLVKLTVGFSCSDISSIANEAAFGPLRDVGSIDAIKDISLKDLRHIQMKDFENSIQNSKKSVSVDLLKRYKEWESAQAAVTA